MPILRRKDGMQLILQAYRESLVLKNASLLEKEIRFLAHTNGEYSRFFKQPNGHVEAVFSRDQGYLLGETVWQHFGKPDDLIYCEELPGTQQILVVIVRARTVYLDAKIPHSQLIDELASLLAGQHHFAIYTYGDVPLAEYPEPSAFAFNEDKVKSFNILEDSLLAALVPNPTLQLLPLDQAITELDLKKGIPKLIVISLGTIIIIGLWYWLMLASSNQVPSSKVSINPLAQYQADLATPDPSKQIKALVDNFTLALSIPGWIPTQAQAETSATGAINLHLQLHSLGGFTAGLLQWAAQHDGDVNFSSTGAELYLPMPNINRNNTIPLNNTKSILAAIIDGMMQILPQKSIQINHVTNHSAFNEVALTVSFNSIAPDVLKLVADKLAHLPIKLLGYSITLDNGLLTGQIKLTVLGT